MASQDFYSTFLAACREIRSGLDTCAQSNTDLTSQLTQEVQSQRKSLNDATESLPSRDRLTCENQLQELESRLDAIKSKGVAKSKFAFKKSLGSSSNVSPRVIQATQPISQAVPAENIDFRDDSAWQSSVYIDHNELHARTNESVLSKLVESVVNLTSREAMSEALPPTSIHVKDVKNSILILGYVQGSCLMHSLDNCVVIVACHQLRIHTSRNTRFYLHVSSNAIIEDCEGLWFAPYPDLFPLPSEIRSSKSTHDDIQDFSHLLSTPSPNWRIVSEEEAKSEDEQWPEIYRSVSNLSEIKQRSGCDLQAAIKDVLDRSASLPSPR